MLLGETRAKARSTGERRTMPNAQRAQGVRPSREAFPFWSLPAAQVLAALETTPEGLSSAEVAERLVRYGPNRLRPKRRTSELVLFLGQFRSPIILILIAAALLSLFLRDATNALVILAIVLLSGALGFWQERGAANAVRRLIDIVRVRAWKTSFPATSSPSARAT
jgi:magnesium-transporting ATPase (P-type)